MVEINGRCGHTMRLVLVGPPGSGKGTQAALLTERMGLRYIGTGVALRDAAKHGTPIGKLAKPLINRGELVPDQLVNDLIAEMFRGPDRPEQFVLDGYPRTLPQAESFDALLTEFGEPLDRVVDLVIDDEEVVRRISGRRSCPNPDCGTSYHLQARPPRVVGICDLCGSPLVQRPDDSEETIRRRLRVYRASTQGLLDYYRAKGLLQEISAYNSVETIYRHIVQAIQGNGHQGSEDSSGKDSPSTEAT